MGFLHLADTVLANLPPGDLVNRQLVADSTKRFWVCDITYVANWSKFAYVWFVTEVYSRRIVGRNVAATLESDVLLLQGLDMAVWQSVGDLDGVIHHSGRGPNYMSMVYTSRVAELGAIPLTGTIGDSYDNSIAEAVNPLCKAELVRQQGPWRTVEQVEYATLELV